MFTQTICWTFLVFFASTECVTFKQRISKKNVNGVRMKVCEYKLMNMLPKSSFLDGDACLKCSCSGRALTCKDITNLPGCKLMPGGQMTQNPFAKEWKTMLDGLIKKQLNNKYQILQVRTQVVAGTNIYMWLLVNDRLCDLNVFKNLQERTQITKDSCAIGR